jgi:hypothetical protein
MPSLSCKGSDVYTYSPWLSAAVLPCSGLPGDYRIDRACRRSSTGRIRRTVAEYELTYGELVSGNVVVRYCTFNVSCMEGKGRKAKASRNTQYICCLAFNLQTPNRYREKERERETERERENRGVQ